MNNDQNRLDEFSRKLKSSLQGALKEPEVSAIAGDGYRMMGIIVSPTFEGLDEADRQRIVWERVLKAFDERERRMIEFLFTDAPSERVPAQIGVGPNNQDANKG